MTDHEFYANRDHSDLNQASHPDYLDHVNDEIEKQKTMKDYASRDV